MAIPDLRLRALNARAERPDGRFVLYWMTAARRVRHSFAMDRAVAHARRVGRPLVVLEALRLGHPRATARMHRFALDGMADNAARLAATPVAHYPYVEPAPGEGRGLLEALAAHACLVVTDDAPHGFLPRMAAAGAARVGVRMEAVDGNGLMPLRAAPRAFTHAHLFRRWLHSELPAWLGRAPLADPLAGAPLPRLADGVLADVRARWPAAGPALLRGRSGGPADPSVPVGELRGGSAWGEALLESFAWRHLDGYAEGRDDPSRDATSGLSPYLHWGFVGAHQVFGELARAEGWRAPERFPAPTGKREGWWGMRPAAEAFLDEMVTWRELCLNAAAHLPAHDRYEGLPRWSRETLESHAADPRPALLPWEVLEEGRTGDVLWDAAQAQLRETGRLHNRVRMLWGKRILSWTADPAQAFAWALELNDRWALDGGDASSAGGVAWCFGRYDRPWGPERAIYGTVRVMTSASQLRRAGMREYVERWGAEQAALAI